MNRYLVGFLVIWLSLLCIWPIIIISLLYAKHVVRHEPCTYEYYPFMQRICLDYMKNVKNVNSSAPSFLQSLMPPDPMIPGYMNESHWLALQSNEPDAHQLPSNWTQPELTEDQKRVREKPHLLPMKEAKFDLFIPDIGYKVTKNLKENYTTEAWKCLNMTCLCPYFNGTMKNQKCILSSGKPLNKAIRKEYRMLTDEERHRYNNAFKQLMSSGIFDEIAVIHLYMVAKTHGKSVFWAWHRGYLKKLEYELRRIDPDLAIPYWDTTLDQDLPDPTDSIMWSDDFMGRSDENGTVISGPAAHWTTLSGTPLVRRKFWQGYHGFLFFESDLKLLLKETQINQHEEDQDYKYHFSCSLQLNLLELLHAAAHDFVGGDMQDLHSASNDPIFYSLHSFIDLILEIWKQHKDPKCILPGLETFKNDETYTFVPRPTCSHENPDCGSSYLFCDRSKIHARCAPKIRHLGSCRGLKQEDNPCLNGRCIEGQCVRNNEKTNSTNPYADTMQLMEFMEEAKDPKNQEDVDLFNLAGRLRSFMVALGR